METLKYELEMQELITMRKVLFLTDNWMESEQQSIQGKGEK